MGSLSIDAGEPREENFHEEVLLYTEWITHHLTNGVETSQGYPGTRWYNSIYDVYHGRDLPNFHERKRKGELLPFTRYLKVTQPVLELTGKYDLLYLLGGGGNVFSNWREPYPIGSLPGTTPYLYMGKRGGGYSPFDILLYNLAETDLFQVKGMDARYLTQLAAHRVYTRGWDIGTFLAELHKTAQLLVSAARTMVSLYSEFWYKFSKAIYDARQDKLPDQMISQLFQRWLEGRYGWRLLCKDIEDIAYTLLTLDTKFHERQKWVEEVNLTWEEDLSYSEETANDKRIYSDIRSINASVRGLLVADFIPAKISVNPFVTGWEVIPYSFVVDWFLGVGQAISALSFLIVSDQYTAAWAYKYNCTRTGVLTHIPKGTNVYDAYQTVDQTYEVISRNPCTVPTIPAFSNRFDLPKFIDLAGLLFGLLTGIKLLKAPYR